MKRAISMLTLSAVLLTLTGCQACKQMFGMDRRCESPPPQYYQPQPVMNYAPVPGTCTSPK